MQFTRWYSALIISMVLFIISDCSEIKSKESQLPFLNTDLTIDERVTDLVSRMTLEEKISQMVNDAPPIDRLGIPRYNWWSEGLHGVARAGLATVFPQAIGLAATWDKNLLFNVSTAIADEARAKHENFARKDKRFIYQGLTLWSPNINIFRDPRWGRGQETYGEDPYLTGSLAVQFIKGLQGDDPNYFKTIATIKHFAVHSGPEPERHTFNATTEIKDLKSTYLPQFEMAVREGKPYSAMCAYNRYNGEPCCGSPGLLGDILRKEWGFTGYIVSDCEAITDIYKHHKVVATEQEAAALAVKSGTDLECGKVYLSLKEAVTQKLISEAEIDVAVKRLFTARFKLGMFDPVEKVKYKQIPYEVVDSKAHKALALEAAHKSIVLLKNENNVLPLKRDVGSIAVIGPNADQWLMLLGNYNGVPSDAITPLRGIKEKVSGNTRVMFAQGSELASGMPMFYTIPPEVLFHGDHEKGLKAEYHADANLDGKALFSRIESNLDVNWSDKAPRNDMDDDNFSVRWTGEIHPTKSGIYQLGFITTCNTKLYLNDSLIAKTIYHFKDEYGDPRLRKSVPIKLEAGKKYKIAVDAIETFADAQVQLVWAAPKPDLKKEALAIANKADVIVMCMGLTPRMEGEEMDVMIDGFRGGDRTRIDLPDIQQDLIKAVHALGKPVILVLLNGSALAVNWENEKIPAIVEAWYPGQAAGQALADVLFGHYNPGGKLPVTFYKSLDGLPSFNDYNITTQTYRYFKGTPLYPFGYGLSYTKFQYDNFEIKSQNTTSEPVKLSVDITNTGKIDGDEIVQIYISESSKPQAPIRSLIAYERIHIHAGESHHFTLPLQSALFHSYGKDFKGKVTITIGGGQTATATSNILTKQIDIL